MLPRDERLKTADFAAAFAAGRVLRHPLLQVRVFHRAPALQEKKRGQSHAQVIAQTLNAQARVAFVVGTPAHRRFTGWCARGRRHAAPQRSRASWSRK